MSNEQNQIKMIIGDAANLIWEIIRQKINEKKDKFSLRFKESGVGDIVGEALYCYPWQNGEQVFIILTESGFLEMRRCMDFSIKYRYLREPKIIIRYAEKAIEKLEAL